MTPERWRQVEQVCHEALAHPAQDRPQFLDRRCGTDHDLRRQVESLLAEQRHAETLLRTPAWDAAAVAFEDDAPSGGPRLLPGHRLGPFEINDLVGAGGMGEVYRARDTRLGRTVALKVLPPDAAADPDRRHRLEVEARAVSAFNHPHICALFDTRSDEGIDYLVMEYLEGVTLAERLGRAEREDEGGLTLGEALEYGAEIAEALTAAHREGIVHRDLKPGNVMLTREGVKLLDFGLAKMKTPVLADAAGVAAPAPRTAAGVVLGTVNYMSPEQLQGREADPRSDLFSFGALLYEMVTGRRAFDGASPASVMAAILDREPSPPSDWQPVAPATLDLLVQGCLAKDPARRWDSALLAAAELRRIAADIKGRDPKALLRGAPTGGARRARAVARLRRPLILSAGGLSVILALVLWQPWRTSPPLVRMQRIDLDLGMGFSPHPHTATAALSPDGARAVFAGRTADGEDLFVRSFDRPEVVPLHVGGGSDLFFSPDGQWVGFFRDRKIRKVKVTGGPDIEMCDAPMWGGRGASWGDDGLIVLGLGQGEGLWRLPAGGGVPSPLTTLDASRRELTHRWPQVLPGSNVVIFTSHTFLGRYDEATIEAVDVATGTRKTLHRGGYFGRYVPSGHLVFVRHNVLFAAPMDLDRLELTGPPVPVIEAVLGDEELGRMQLSFANTGAALALTGHWEPPRTVPAWRERDGRVTRLPVPPGDYADPRLSPDARRVLFTERQGVTRQIIVCEQGRDTPLRLVSSSIDMSPVWAPDGEHIAFNSDRDRGVFNLYWRRADGAGEVQRLTRSPNLQAPSSFSPDGRRLVFVEFESPTGSNTKVLSLELADPDHPVPGEAVIVGDLANVSSWPVLSPDGRWFAYTSSESGTSALYVRASDGVTGKWLAAAGGFGNPEWTRDGRSVLFQGPDHQVMVVDVGVRARALIPGTPRPWPWWTVTSSDPRHTLRNFDVSPDGRRLLILDPADPPGAAKPRAAVTLLQNFFDELRRLAPVTSRSRAGSSR
jgi:hypothetical protein